MGRGAQNMHKKMMLDYRCTTAFLNIIHFSQFCLPFGADLSSLKNSRYCNSPMRQLPLPTREIYFQQAHHISTGKLQQIM
jgi:hypothetical protein